jgi:sugar phosphate isomerase/epimerase
VNGVHPRLSVHAACSWSNDFHADLTLWETLGIHRVGLLEHKLEQHGLNAAINELLVRDLAITSYVTGWFDLSTPDGWPARRDAVRRALDNAERVRARCVYLPAGPSDGRRWERLLDSFADALAPCVAHAAGMEVRLAFEPSARLQVSFVNTLRDALLVTRRVGVAVDVDFASCWMERDVEAAISALGGQLALVQVADVSLDAARGVDQVDVRVLSGPVRKVPGDGDLDLERLVRATLAAGYDGPFELELLGPAIEAEGYQRSLTRALAATSDLLARAGA